MKKYIVICKEYAVDVEEEVIKLEYSGYSPLGGISVTYNPDSNKYLYAQAMVYNDND